VQRPDKTHAPRESVVVGNNASKYTVVTVGRGEEDEEDEVVSVVLIAVLLLLLVVVVVEVAVVVAVELNGASSTVRNLQFRS
jgi:hypothetical protein